VGAYSADVFLSCGGGRVFYCLSDWWLWCALVPLAENYVAGRKPGCILAADFHAGMFSLVPDIYAWLHVVRLKAGGIRIVGDFLIHYLNLAGAYMSAPRAGCGLVPSTASRCIGAVVGADSLWPSRLRFGSGIRLGETNGASENAEETGTRRATKQWLRRRWCRAGCLGQQPSHSCVASRAFAAEMIS